MLQLPFSWAQYIFYAGIGLGIMAQVIAFLTGPKKWARGIGMVFGIAAMLLIAEAGQIVNQYLKAAATMFMQEHFGVN